MSRHPGKIVSVAHDLSCLRRSLMEMADATDRDTTGDPEDAI